MVECRAVSPVDQIDLRLATEQDLDSGHVVSYAGQVQGRSLVIVADVDHGARIKQGHDCSDVAHAARNMQWRHPAVTAARIDRGLLAHKRLDDRGRNGGVLAARCPVKRGFHRGCFRVGQGVALKQLGHGRSGPVESGPVQRRHPVFVREVDKQADVAHK